MLRSLPHVMDAGEGKYHAQSLGSEQRKKLVYEAFSGTSVSEISKRNYVSRKFIGDQKIKAVNALDAAFDAPKKQEEKILFYIPVTKLLIQQIVLVLILRCHSSYRGVIAFFDDLLDYNISLGTIHNIVSVVIPKAEAITNSIDLSAIKGGAHDEIYQSNKPVFAGVDVHSSYTYILSEQDHADGDTWGLEILEAMDRGFNPKFITSDLGPGLRKGHNMVLPEVPFYADLFHLLRDLTEVDSYYNKKLEAAINARIVLDDKMKKLELRGKKKSKYSRKLAIARVQESSLSELTDGLAILIDWLQSDILALNGPDYTTRHGLFEFVLDEFRKLEEGYEKVVAARKSLETHKLEYLAFAKDLEQKINSTAQNYEIPNAVLQKMIVALGLKDFDPKKYKIVAELRSELGERFHEVKTEIEELLSEVVRASSIVENTNSILRNYFFLRKSAGPEFLKLLQFYLNHRVLKKSTCKRRKNKSPREALTGKKHLHWLELLGYERLDCCA